jgi:2-succinyl-5-enolpyruvyl-6-hydroxy-3-cyclohexene-1-carboxylate synthase
VQQDELGGHGLGTMTRTAADTYRGLRAFTDELVRCGVRHACTSPGSRSTPLVLSLVRDGRLDCTSHVDERAGAFFGLGLAQVSGMPSVLACTSGTAAANYAPAVIEAFEARVPLIVLTADRPPELRDVGAGQTIDQVKLYGRAAKWFFEVDDVEVDEGRLRWLRQLACRAVWTSLEGRPGPVHLNLALREPLVLDEALEPDASGRPGGRPYVRWQRPSAAAADLPRGERPVVVAGRTAGVEEVGSVAAAVGGVVLADPLSGARVPGSVAHYDHLLRSPDWDLVPDLVVRMGDLPTSKPLRAWLAGLSCEQVLLDPHWAWQDPAAAVSAIVPYAETGVTAALRQELRSGWRDAWLERDAVAAEALRGVLGDGLTEPRVAAALYGSLPSDALLFVASSMPIRDLEAFAVPREDPPRVLSNRGANGIDGLISTALGAAHAHDGPAVLLIGDVAFLHDLGGLLATKRTPAELTIVLLDNDGGGIFHFLPVAKEGDDFEHHVATPHGIDFAKAAALFDIAYHQPADLASFEAAVAAPGTKLVHVRTERRANRELHATAAHAVLQSVRRAT